MRVCGCDGSGFGKDLYRSAIEEGGRLYGDHCKTKINLLVHRITEPQSILRGRGHGDVGLSPDGGDDGTPSNRNLLCSASRDTLTTKVIGVIPHHYSNPVRSNGSCA